MSSAAHATPVPALDSQQEEQLRKDIAAHAKKGANWYLEDSHERVSTELEGKAERRGCLCLRPRARKDRAMSG